MTVTGALVPESIPDISLEARLLLVIMLGAAGMLFLRLRT